LSNFSFSSFFNLTGHTLLLQIRFEHRLRGDKGKTCKMTVDGTDFMIWQPFPFSKNWFSHKFKGPGVRYEVGVCIQTGDICWINGPYPCGAWPDIKIFREHLIHRLPPGEKVEADDGYRGEPEKIRTPGIAVSQADLRAKKRARHRHETVNSRFKNWGCLGLKFRHRIDEHAMYFTAVAVCTQIALESYEPLFQTVY
jgi:hypothetical protein